MENITLKDLLDLGANGILIYLVLRLLNRLDVITDRLFVMLAEAKSERHLIAKQNGLDTTDLTNAAKEVRAKLGKPDNS